ncbi:hypothetical protein V6N11_082123 [Hibiscus sabdariffa]|uniref:Uncharacterized protein n=1 Tax=Hibiscus sabdariffa TaxID=183260 RepID=A0ABR2QH19_9ROSI
MVLERRTESAWEGAQGEGASHTIGRWQALGCGCLAHHRQLADPRVRSPRTASSREGAQGAVASHTIGLWRHLGADASHTIGSLRTLRCWRLEHHREGSGHRLRTRRTPPGGREVPGTRGVALGLAPVTGAPPPPPVRFPAVLRRDSDESLARLSEGNTTLLHTVPPSPPTP